MKSSKRMLTTVTMMLTLGIVLFSGNTKPRYPISASQAGGEHRSTFGFWGKILEEGPGLQPASSFAEPQRQDPSQAPPLKIRPMGKDHSEMVLIPAGIFLMGSDKSDPDEGPAHKVTLGAFWIDRHEVTNAQYMKFMAETRHRPPANWSSPKFSEPDQPVVGVSWEDAAAYAKWAGKRLPTEAEWEKAARGEERWGEFVVYPWGNRWDERKANSAEAVLGKTTGARSLPEGASPFSVLHMAGNAAEWVADWFDPNYYQKSPQENPKGPEEGTWKVVRGGGWWCKSVHCRVTDRRKELPTTRTSSIGFRCALDAN